MEHREPDRVPWGEAVINYNVYEEILGRPTLVEAKMRQTQAYWDGRRDEVVKSYKQDCLDLVRALDMDIVCVNRMPPRATIRNRSNGSEWEWVHHAVKEMKKTHFIMLHCSEVGFPGFGATEEDFWISLLEEPEICRKHAELAGKQQLRQVQLYA